MVPCITRLNPKLDRKLRELAKENERSISAELRVAVKEHVRKSKVSK